MKIGAVNVNGIAALAPMAGVTDRAFREICKDFGACYVVSEMVSAKAITFADEKTKRLMRISERERPVGIQLFGDDVDTMTKAAKYALTLSPDVIDINMGCPAPKVSKSGSGAALMRDPELCARIVNAVKNVSHVPVTVKIRKGWDECTVNAVTVASRCEKAGADAICIHGRTRMQMYSGEVDMSIIKKVKQAVNIPVIGNGDVTSLEQAVLMKSQTNCDMVMIGRGALGNPWIFEQINKGITREISIDERIDVMLKHAGLICAYKGEKFGMKQARKHLAWYIKGIYGAASYRDRCMKIKSLDDLVEFCDDIKVHCGSH